MDKISRQGGTENHAQISFEKSFLRQPLKSAGGNFVDTFIYKDCLANQVSCANLILFLYRVGIPKALSRNIPVSDINISQDLKIQAGLQAVRLWQLRL